MSHRNDDDWSFVPMLQAWSKELWQAANREQLIKRFHVVLVEGLGCAKVAIFAVHAKGGKLNLSRQSDASFDVDLGDELRDLLVALGERGELGDGFHRASLGKQEVHFACFGDLKLGGHVVVWSLPDKGADSLDTLVGIVQHELRWHSKLDCTEALLYIDELTGLYNYRYLDLALTSELRRASRYQQNFSLLFIDLDNFKDVNDRYGHLAGSALLKEVGLVLKEELREVDTIIRYGGDEYVVILIGAPTETGVLVGERIRSRVASNPLTADGHQIAMTASIGVASYPEHGRDKETLLRIADETMYQSKREGKNRVMIVGAQPSRLHKRSMTISS